MNKKSPPPVRTRLKVLIADESAAARVSLSFLISDTTDAKVVGFAWTGAAALELVRQLKPDLMTLDLGMTEMSGLRLLEALRRERLHTDVIVFTGLAWEKQRQRSLELGAKDFLQKGSGSPRLAELIQDYGRRRSRPKRKILVT